MIRLFASHPTAANILMLAFVVLGLAALPTLQRDTFPLVPPAEVEVRIAYPGATPAEVERGICAEVEDPIRAIDDLAELACRAREGVAVITAEIAEGADMGDFKDDVTAAVDGVTGYPDRAEDPVVRVVERVANVTTIAVTGPDDAQVLLAYADELAERLKADPAIAQVAIGGFSDREIRIEPRADALRRHGLTLSDIAAALGRSSLDMPAGTMEGAAVEAAVRFLGERRNPAELAAIPVAGTPGGGDLRLGDIARIEIGFSDPAQAAFFNGERAALVTVSKTPQQDSLRVKAAVVRQLEAARAEAPGNIALTIAQDPTTNIRERLRIIGENGLQGLLLVLVVMGLFLVSASRSGWLWAFRSRSSARSLSCRSSATRST